MTGCSYLGPIPRSERLDSNSAALHIEKVLRVWMLNTRLAIKFDPARLGADTI